MGVLDTLSRLLAGNEAATPPDAVGALVNLYTDCVRHASQLERHAELAPQACGARLLRRLAAEDGQQAAGLRQAIQVAGASVPSPTAEVPRRDGLNHWARLVEDLEAHRRCVTQSRELALRFAARLPQTAALFESLSHAEACHCEELRGLIARADPQALD